MTKALLVLADGTSFQGQALGFSGSSIGEVIFNTSISGYQEILTDPSYAQQIVTLTYPHIGNVGINGSDYESKTPYAKGLIVRDAPEHYHNWRGELSLHEWMIQQKVVGISGVDTRALTNHLRTAGAQAGCIFHGDDEAQALAQAQAFVGLENTDLAKVVSCQSAYEWMDSTWALDGLTPTVGSGHHVVVMDFGVKQNMLRLLVERGCKVTVVPAMSTIESILSLKPDGVLLSNGPGDPQPCTYAIETIQSLLERKVPMMGICLGHQLLALACGANTEKMKCGHHGANHPVQDLATKRVMITSQNHGFAVSDTDFPPQLKVTHRSLFDVTIQGIAHQSAPAFSFQGHPEANPGPQDAVGLFDQFMNMMQEARS